MKAIFRVWRQRSPRDAGGFVRYTVDDLSPEMTLLEALDRLNEALVTQGEPPVAFDSDCREGICGACGIVVDGRPHGPLPRTTTCLVPMRDFRDGATITLEPFRTGALPRAARPRRGSARARPRDAGRRLRVRAHGQRARGQCAAHRARGGGTRAGRRRPASAAGPAWPPAPTARRRCSSGAKVSHLGRLPQGQPERARRGARAGGRGGPRGLRRLLEPRRVRGGVPEGHRARRDRPDEPRPPARGPRALQRATSRAAPGPRRTSRGASPPSRGARCCASWRRRSRRPGR